LAPVDTVSRAEYDRVVKVSDGRWKELVGQETKLCESRSTIDRLKDENARLKEDFDRVFFEAADAIKRNGDLKRTLDEAVNHANELTKQLDEQKQYTETGVKQNEALRARIRELEESRKPEFRFIQTLESAHRVYENERAQRPPLMALKANLFPLPPSDLAVTITDTTNAEVTAPTKPAGAAEAITNSPSA